MARIYTLGAEFGNPAVEGVTANFPCKTGIVRSGRFAYAPTAISSQNLAVPLNVTGDKCFLRRWMHVSNYPTVIAEIGRTYQGGSVLRDLRLLPTGEIRANAGPAGQSVPVPKNEWFLIEESWERTATETIWTCRVNGVQAFSGSMAMGANWPSQVRIGNLGGASGLPPDYRLDDIAMNDATGAEDNSWPSVTAGITALLPKADVQQGAFLGPTGLVLADLSKRVDSTPIPANTNSISSNPSTQLIRADASAIDTIKDYRATLQTPNEAGALLGAIVTHVRTHAVIGTSNVSSVTIRGALHLEEVEPAEVAFAQAAQRVSSYPNTAGFPTVKNPQIVGSELIGVDEETTIRIGRRIDATGAILYVALLAAVLEIDPAPVVVPVPVRPIGIIGG